MGKVGPYLLVFKDRKTYVLSDPTGRAYRPISSSIGCSAHRSIVETDKGTIFLSADMGVCITDGTNIQQISEAVRPLLRYVADNNPADLKRACATYHEESYYLSVPYGSGNNNIILEYKTDTRAWWIHTAAADDFALLDPHGTPRLYSAYPATNRIERSFAPNTYTDDDVPYESYWTGPHWTWGNPHLNKRVSQLRMDGLGVWKVFGVEQFADTYEELDSDPWEEAEGLITFAPAVVDGEIFAPAADDGQVFAGGQGVFQKRYYTPLQGWGRAWSFKITDQGLSASSMAVYSIAAFLRARTD